MTVAQPPRTCRFTARLREVTPRQGKGTLGQAGRHGGGTSSLPMPKLPSTGFNPVGRGVGVLARAFSARRGRSLRDSPGRQPDSGNPTVRDDTGGLGKRDPWSAWDPTPQAKARRWSLRPNGARASVLSQLSPTKTVLTSASHPKNLIAWWNKACWRDIAANCYNPHK